LLALPAASVILVLLRYLAQRYKLSDLYTEEGQPDSVIAEVDISVQEDRSGHVDVSVVKDNDPS